jgi:hypothetical protein
MTPQDALAELLSRLYDLDAEVLVTAQELSLWPAEAVSAMKSQKLIVKARPAKSTVCPGCEKDCIMPVHTLSNSAGTNVSFIVCDKRSDINRVQLSSEQLTQWRLDAAAVCNFVASSLELNRSTALQADKTLLIIGMVRGKKRSQILALQVIKGLKLIAGSSSTELIDLVSFNMSRYEIDVTSVIQMIDTATTADPLYTPSTAKRESRKIETQAMYASWQKEFRSLRKKHTNKSDVWFSQQITKLPIAKGRSSDTIKKHMKS